MIVGARYLRYPIRDVSVPISSELMLKILDAIDQHINESKFLYVHCWRGIGRTGTVV
ncbi:protein-tyrosine phosphatase family protein [uncultured Desulfobulbus sp.]|uniref:protein-tyrosine phosphatase family protein n=1 Tax=uncultured Desulfobulbus sp. TaxID=239745 RepID=UPI00374CF643